MSIASRDLVPPSSDRRYVALLGAYERDNFGDILFMHVTERLLSPWPTLPLGVISADMSTIGGRQILSASSWFNVCADWPPSALIAVGGEILTCDLESALAFTMPHALASAYVRLAHTDKIQFGERISPGMGAMPYADLTKLASKIPIPIKIGYNSIGGTQLEGLEKLDAENAVRAGLSCADYLSVREETTRSNLARQGIITENIYPDVVSSIAEVCSDRIESAKWNLAVLQDFDEDGYLIFQASDRYLTDRPTIELARQLHDAAVGLNLSIVFQPAGLAYEHDTIDSLEKLRASIVELGLPNRRLRIQYDRDVWLQVATIAKSRCFIGTSLHGRIVSAALGIPRVSLENSKVAAYAKCWDGKLQPYDVPPERIYESVSAALKTDQQTLSRCGATLSSKAQEGFTKLREALEISAFPGSTEPTIQMINERSKSVLYSEIMGLRTHAAEFYCGLANTRRQFRETARAMKSMENSWSWRLTSPLRRAKGLLWRGY